MPTMRALKIAGIVAAACIGLVVGALLLAWTLFDPNDHKDRLQSAFRDATGRELRLDGELSLSIFPWLAFETGAASVSNREGFGDEPFAALEHARVGVRLWPLLAHRRIEFGPVRVDGLRVDLAVARDGRDNWSDLIERFDRAPAEPTPGPQTEAPDFSIASLTLREARLQFADAEAGTRYVVEHWTLETGRLRRGEAFDLATSLDLQRNERPLGHYELDTRVDLSAPGSLALLDTQGRVALPRAQAQPLELSLASPRIALANATRDLAVDALTLHVGPAVVTTSLTVRQGPSGPRASGRIELAETSPRALLEALGVTAPRTRDAKVLARLAAKSNLRYAAAQGLELDALDLRLDDTRLQGRLSVPDLERLPLRFELRGTAIDLDRYLPPDDAKPAAAAAAPARDAEARRKLDVRGTLAFDKVVVAAVPLERVTVDLRVRDGALAFEPLRARVFGGTAETRLRHDFVATVPALRIDQRLTDIDVGAALAQVLQVRQLQGRGSGRFQLQTHGTGSKQLFANLTGPFDLTVTNGALLGADLWFEIERAIAAAQLKGSAATARSTGRTEFERFAARGMLVDRRLRNERLEFDADFARVRGHGDVDYGRDALDLDLVAQLLKAPSGRLLGLKLSRVKGADIPLRVTGSLTEPKVRPDVSSLLEAYAKDAVKQPLEGKVKEQLEKIFKF